MLWGWGEEGGGGYLTMSGGEGILDNVGNTGECVLLGSGWGLCDCLFVFVLFCLFCFVLFLSFVLLCRHLSRPSSSSSSESGGRVRRGTGPGEVASNNAHSAQQPALQKRKHSFMPQNLIRGRETSIFYSCPFSHPILPYPLIRLARRFSGEAEIHPIGD